MKIIQNFVFLLDTFLLISGNLQNSYSKLRFGYRLDRKMIDSYTEYSILDCVEECLRTTRCKSVSYYKGANYCEISYENETTAHDKYKEDKGWTYSEREDWDPKITGSCSEAKCQDNEKCIPQSLGNYTCKLSDCGLPPDVDGADMDSVERWDAIGIYRQLNVKCRYKYTLKGPGLFNCLSNGQWEIHLICEWPRFGNKAYTVGSRKLNWNNAKGACKSKGAYLAEIETEKENTWITDNLLKPLYEGSGITEWTLTVLWIGGFCVKEGQGNITCRWQDSDSELRPYHNWHGSDPSGDGQCVYLAESGKWNDFPCEHERFYVCEKPV